MITVFQIITGGTTSCDKVLHNYRKLQYYVIIRYYQTTLINTV